MNTWYVNKTNMPMFDATRAYGLAELISKIVGDEMITIRDMGNAYKIEYEGNVPKVGESEKARLESLFADSTKFDEPLTTQLRDKQNIINSVREVIIDSTDEILDSYSDPTFQVKTSARKEAGMMTLYQSLDVVASKSIRELRLGLTYDEGGQLYVDEQNFSIALIGSAYFRHFRRAQNFMLSIIPNPLEVNVLQHIQIQNDMDVKGLCTISHLTALSHYAVSLALILGYRREKSAYSNAYDHLIFNEMQRTGKQFKPSASGKYPLEYCLNLSLNEEGMASLNIMKSIFSRGFVKGHPQKVAYALAQFISDPSLDNYLYYIDSHLRGYIEKDKSKRVIYLYDKLCLEELFKYVRHRRAI